MDPITSALVQYGLPGIVIAALAGWCKMLHDRNEKLQDLRVVESQKYAADLRAAFEQFDSKLSAERASRLQDAKDAGAKMLELTGEVHETVDRAAHLVEILHRPPQGSAPQLPSPQR